MANSFQNFHRYPHSKPDLVSQWVRAMRRKFVPNKYSLMCSEHFSDSDFDRTGQTLRLREGAVPSLFDLPAHLRQVGSGSEYS